MFVQTKRMCNKKIILLVFSSVPDTMLYCTFLHSSTSMKSVSFYKGGKWDSECLGHLTSNNKTAFARGLFDHPNLSLRFREIGDWVVRH